jgi:hypothetical protein
MHAAQLDKVSGITTFYGTKWLWRYIIWAIICFFLAYILHYSHTPFGYNPMLRSSGVSIASIVPIIIGIILLYFSRRKVFFLKIYSSQAASAPIAVGEGYAFGSTSAIYSLIGAPSSQTDLMMKELDAMINDLQSGDRAAIARWTGEEEEND